MGATDHTASVPMPLTIEVLSEPLSVCRLAAGAAVPAWALGAGSFCSITRTADELSVICATTRVPREPSHPGHSAAITARDDGWRAIKLVGPFALTEAGVLLGVAAPLAAARITILPVATFETDYVLIPEARLATALVELRAAGHSIVLAERG